MSAVRFDATSSPDAAFISLPPPSGGFLEGGLPLLHDFALFIFTALWCAFTRYLSLPFSPPASLARLRRLQHPRW